MLFGSHLKNDILTQQSDVLVCGTYAAVMTVVLCEWGRFKNMQGFALKCMQKLQLLPSLQPTAEYDLSSFKVLRNKLLQSRHQPIYYLLAGNCGCNINYNTKFTTI